MNAMTPPRTIKLAVCITLYNENADELKRTLHGLADAVHVLVQRGILAWEQVLIFIVADGMDKVWRWHGCTSWYRW